MPFTPASELLQPYAALRLTAEEALMPVLACLAGAASAWLQAVHPPATAHEHDDPALVALLVL